METAGIEPASAVAKRMASTSVAGALISPSGAAPTGCDRKASPLKFPLAARAGRFG